MPDRYRGPPPPLHLKSQPQANTACDEKRREWQALQRPLERYYDYPNEVAAVNRFESGDYRCEFLAQRSNRPDPAPGRRRAITLATGDSIRGSEAFSLHGTSGFTIGTCPRRRLFPRAQRVF